MEDQLDEIEEGKLDWRTALQDFYEKFSKDLSNAVEDIKNVKKQAIPTDEICDKCGAGMVIKFGRFGQFLACANYPECKTTREVGSKKADGKQDSESSAVSSETSADGEEIPACEHCGKGMVLKSGRFGKFYGCSGYPECKNIRKIPKGSQTPTAPPVELDETCPVDGAKLVKRQGRFGEFISCSNYPKCNYIKRETLGIPCTKCKTGEIAVKKSKRGKEFYGCTNYPKCDVVFWDKPITEPCPKCNAPFLFEKTTKKDGTTRYCSNCDYKIAVNEDLTESKDANEARLAG